MPEKAGEMDQLDSTDSEAIAALNMELMTLRAALEDKRQVLCSPRGVPAFVTSCPHEIHGINKDMELD